MTGTRTTATHGYVASVLQPHWAIRLEPLFLQFLPLMSSWHANEDRVALISITSISLCNRAPIDATIDMLGAYGYVVCSAKPSQDTALVEFQVVFSILLTNSHYCIWHQMLQCQSFRNYAISGPHRCNDRYVWCKFIHVFLAEFSFMAGPW